MRIVTERLELVPLAPDVLRHVLRDEREAVGRALGAHVPDGWTEFVPAQRRLEQLGRDPSELPWLVRAMVLRTDRRVVGVCGFHAPPDADGRVELGYGVLAAERRQGYAREAVRGLAAWAVAGARARLCAASITPANVASLALVRSLGFRQVGEQIDEVDGLELVFERPLPLD